MQDQDLGGRDAQPHLVADLGQRLAGSVKAIHSQGHAARHFGAKSDDGPQKLPRDQTPGKGLRQGTITGGDQPQRFRPEGQSRALFLNWRRRLAMPLATGRCMLPARPTKLS